MKKLGACMNNRRGFTLIEVMIALACIVGALSVTVHFSMALYRSWKETAGSIQMRMSLQAALDVVRRDLERAPCEQVSHESASHESVGHKPALKSVAQWYVTGPHEIIWRDHNSSEALRICVVKGRLERCEGAYDERTRQWHTRSVSVLANDIKELRFVLHKKNSHSSVTHESVTHESVTHDQYMAVEVTLLTHTGYEEHALIAFGVGTLS
jgi:prepilin-type N-terminal cleavage/methylation domain-containing protein